MPGSPHAPTTKSAKPLSKKDGRKALEAATLKIRTLQKNVGRNFHAIGTELSRITRLELHAAKGYETIQLYAEAELGISGSTAFQYMRVAGAFSGEACALFGVEKLDLGLRYIALTTADELPSDVPALRIEVPLDSGTVEKRFEDLTVADLRLATQALRGKRAKPVRTTVPTELRRRAATAARKLDQAVGPKAARQANVLVRGARDGAALIDAVGIPVAEASKAFRALAAAWKG